MAANSVTEMMGISGLGLMAIQRGQLHFAFEIISPGLERIERSGSLPPISMAVYGELGVIHYQWLQLEQAHVYFRRAIQLSTLSGYSDAEIYYGVILSRLFQIEGNLEAAAREIQKATDLMQVEAPAAVREEAIAQQVRIYLAWNRPAAAEAALKSYGFSFADNFTFPDFNPSQSISWAIGILYICALRVLLYRAQVKGELSSLQPGIELADQLVNGALQRGYIPVAMETLLLRAQMRAALGNNQTSRADFIQALELGEPEGYISIFVEEGAPIAKALSKLLEGDQLGTIQSEYVRNILAAFARTQPSTEDGSADVISLLTDRELDVLRLMAGELKYEEIATRLFISLNTVRSHVKAIYGKLHVNNRTKVIEAAHQMRIL